MLCIAGYSGQPCRVDRLGSGTRQMRAADRAIVVAWVHFVESSSGTRKYACRTQILMLRSLLTSTFMDSVLLRGRFAIQRAKLRRRWSPDQFVAARDQRYR